MKRILIVLTILVLAGSGCEDFLDPDIRSEYNYNNYFQTEDDLISFANGIYGGLISWTWEGGGLFFNNFWVLQDLASDNAYETGPSIDMHDISNFTFDPNNTVFFYIWQQCYEVINSCNILLQESENIQRYSSPTVKQHLQGEAYFIRGMLYFELVKLFGDVPLYLAPTRSVQNTLIPRTPRAEVYNSIISDLSNAESLLVENPFQYRREGIPTTSAASALLAKVYLTRGALNGNADDFNQCQIQLEKVLGKFSLENEFADIFKLKNANRNEIIWAVNFSATLGEGWTTGQFIVRLMPTIVADNGVYNGQAWERPTDYLFNSYSSADKRKAATFITAFDDSLLNGAYIRKYWDQDAEGGRQNGESDADFIYLRYADVLLMYAEVLNEIYHSPTTAAYNAINDVRNRANVGDLPAGLDYQSFKNAILQERQCEFVMEGQRWYDLVRMGKLYEKVLLAKPNANIKQTHTLFPIPQRERYYNPNLTQNEGYQ